VEEVPELNIPALDNISPLELLTLNQTKKPGIKIQPFSKQRRQLFEGLAKTTIKYVPKQEPTPSVVVAKAAPIPISKPVEPKPVPVVSAPPVVKKEEKIIVTPPPAVVVEKKLPPPAPIIAPSVQQGAAEIDKRAVKVEQALYFDNDSLVLTLYDNGEVDGDTVTIVMNGNIIFSKQGLSTKANTKVVYIPKDADSVKLIMYAESLGEIPPNTGLMVVMDGEKRYDLRFSADLKTSAAIVFRRRIK
jgi:hypothetical protein